MFVVAMTLAVLSTVGAWALQSAALEVRMAGYERQSTQTHYLAEYGVMATMQEVSPTTAQGVLPLALCGTNNGTAAQHAACLSVPCLNFNTTPVSVMTGCTEITTVQPVAQTCFRWEGTSAFPNGFPVPDTTVPILDFADGGASGSAGRLGATSTSGNFSTEITEVANAPPASGFSGGGMTSYWATVTAYGQTSTSGSTASQGTEQLRARVQIGPIPTIVLGTCQ